MLGFSVGNSKSQLHKARLRLRKLLGAGFRETRGDGQQQDTAEVAASFDDVPPPRNRNLFVSGGFRRLFRRRAVASKSSPASR